MAGPAAEQKSGKVAIGNIGLMLSGDIERPILDADTILIEDGLIVQVGRAADCDTAGAGTVIDCRGTAVAPGLIDSHVHPVFGDWTPRQNQLGWIESCLHGGVTTMISAGEVHLPGRPKDVVGVKALAITAQRAFDGMRAAGVGGGVKVLAGAPVIEQGMVEQDFAELAAAGVTLLGEIGLGSVKSGDEAATMVGWARKYGIRSTIHTGGPSIPGSGLIDADVVLAADADVIGHVNGGHTSLPYRQVCTLCERSSRALEIVHNGNERIAILTARHAIELRCPHRVILGTDSPAGSGVQPLGILRLIALLSSLADVPAEVAIGFATGNTARMRGLAQGLIEAGRPADLVFLDRAQHTAGADLLESIRLGDLPGVGMVMIDGIVRCGRSRNTPPAVEVPVVLPRG
jgi:enamidase